MQALRDLNTRPLPLGPDAERDAKTIATVENTTADQISHILDPNADLGPWKLFTLANGDLIVGRYPQADTCELIQQRVPYER